MRKWKKTKKAYEQKEIDTPSVAENKKKKNRRVWVLEFQWKDKKSFNSYPIKWLDNKGEYSDEWKQERWSYRYSSPTAALDSLKSDLRGIWSDRYIAGRNWRVRNIDNGDIEEFPNISEYYKT